MKKKIVLKNATEVNEMNIDSVYLNLSSANQLNSRYESSISNLNRWNSYSRLKEWPNHKIWSGLDSL